jgi:hypothetical protein
MNQFGIPRLGIVAAVVAGLLPAGAHAYPPAVGILSTHRSCMSCHASNGPWKDDSATIVDVVDASSRRSLRQADGSFLIKVERGKASTVVTIIGRAKGDPAPAPLRNAWLYLDPATLATSALSKFAPGWDVNLPMSCRVVGDAVPEYPGASVTALPMTVRPGDAARAAELDLQAMLTAGNSRKGEPDTWMKGTYLVRKVRLKVLEPERKAR